MGVRFGKRPVRHDTRTLRFKTYLTPELPPPPPAFDVLSYVYRKLGVENPARLFPMDGNDACGDCNQATTAEMHAGSSSGSAARSSPKNDALIRVTASGEIALTATP